MLDKLDVPEVNIDDYFSDLAIQIEKSGIADEDLLKVIKETWRFINELQVNCLRMQRNSIQILTIELEDCKKDLGKLKEYKDFFDKHPEVKMMKRQLEKYLGDN